MERAHPRAGAPRVSLLPPHPAPAHAALASGGAPAPPTPAAAPATRSSPFGPLANLPGEWHGDGFNLVELPVPQSDPNNNNPRKIFRVMANHTREILEFAEIAGPIPNRGFQQADLSGENGIFGLTYLQRVNEARTLDAMHKEPGLWLFVPATTSPPSETTVVRQGVIPHGTSILAQGPFIASQHVLAGPPTIDPVDVRPVRVGTTSPITSAAYLKDLNDAIAQEPLVGDPTELLRQQLAGVTVVETVVLKVSTALPPGPPGANVPNSVPPSGPNGVSNIPFNKFNADAVFMESTFWIETVQRPDKSTFLQLQYSQLVMLRFDDIDWPHVSVATLIKS